MLALPILSIGFGVLLLVSGAELVVRAGSGLGRRIGLSPLWIGLTIVAVGTSAPELVVSAAASAQGQGAIAIGNIAGSNILNVLLVLGATAVLHSVAVQRRTTRIDVPIVIAIGLLVAWFAVDGIGRLAGAVLLLLAVAYTAYVGRRERAPVEVEEFDAWSKRPAWQLLLAIAAAIALLVVGGRFVLDGAVAMAAHLGWPPHLVGLTVVALGTSLPELAVSLAAARGGKMDMAVGNLVGSNLLNLTLVLGTAALVSPIPVPAAVAGFDIPVMVFATLLLWGFSATGGRINRLEGAALLAAYIVYVLVLLRPPEWSWM